MALDYLLEPPEPPSHLRRFLRVILFSLVLGFFFGAVSAIVKFVLNADAPVVFYVGGSLFVIFLVLVHLLPIEPIKFLTLVGALLGTMTAVIKSVYYAHLPIEVYLGGIAVFILWILSVLIPIGLVHALVVIVKDARAKKAVGNRR